MAVVVVDGGEQMPRLSPEEPQKTWTRKTPRPGKARLQAGEIWPTPGAPIQRHPAHDRPEAQAAGRQQ